MRLIVTARRAEHDSGTSAACRLGLSGRGRSALPGTATRRFRRVIDAPDSRLRRPQGHGATQGIDLARHLGVALICPFRPSLRLDRATEQAGILRRKLAELKLQGGDDGALFGKPLIEGG